MTLQKIDSTTYGANGLSSSRTEMTSNADVEYFYNEGSRVLQTELDTDRLAERIANKHVKDHLDEGDIKMVSEAECFYLATADEQGRPDCSYKGGLPGFVRVVDSYTLKFPSYDGNGMFRSLGNVLVNRAIGLLFISYSHPSKLRINGDATVSTASAETREFAGAEAVVTVRARQVFGNCPRYLHDRDTGQYSKHCPRTDYVPPDPDWKKKTEYDGIVRRNDT